MKTEAIFPQPRYFIHAKNQFFDGFFMFEMYPNGKIIEHYKDGSKKVLESSIAYNIEVAEGYVASGDWEEVFMTPHKEKVIVRIFSHLEDNNNGWVGYSHIECYSDGTTLVVREDGSIDKNISYTLEQCEDAVDMGEFIEILPQSYLHKSRIVFINRKNALDIYTCSEYNEKMFVEKMLKEKNKNLCLDFIKVIIHNHNGNNNLYFHSDFDFNWTKEDNSKKSKSNIKYFMGYVSNNEESWNSTYIKHYINNRDFVLLLSKNSNVEFIKNDDKNLKHPIMFETLDDAIKYNKRNKSIMTDIIFEAEYNSDTNRINDSTFKVVYAKDRKINEQ